MIENRNAPAGTRARHEGNRSQPHTSASSRPLANDCACEACRALEKESGEHFDLYRRKLLIRNWGGAKSPVEKAYCRAHRKPRSEAQQAALRRASESSPLALVARIRDAERAEAVEGVAPSGNAHGAARLAEVAP